MNGYLANETEEMLTGMGNGELDGRMRRVSRGGARPGASGPGGSGTAVERNDPAGGAPRYQRFEAITVRAAARVMQLQRSGVVSPAEAGFYLSELAAMDAHAGRDAFWSLVRAARRCRR